MNDNLIYYKSTKKSIFYDYVCDNPNIKSRGAYLLLINKYKPLDIDFISKKDELYKWLDYREDFLNKKMQENDGKLICKYCERKDLIKGSREKYNKNNKIHNLATVYHIYPLSKGGSKYDEDNCVVSCKSCNKRKGSDDVDYFVDKIKNNNNKFNKEFQFSVEYIINKQIVLCTMQPNRYRTTEDNCLKFNINNIQISSQRGTKKHKKYIPRFPDLKVSGFTKKHYQIVKKISTDEDHSIYSTGMSGIVSALYFNPKKIYIIGLDFYNKDVKPYYIKEDKDVSYVGHINKSAKGLREGMIKSIYNVCNNFQDIDIYMYTTYRGIKSRKNLHIKYV